MISKTFSAVVNNSKPTIIEVEAAQVSGIPIIQIVGLPSRVVNESITKIVAALKNCAIRIKRRKTIINLAPVDIPKVSSHLELAIAANLLKLNGLCNWPITRYLFLGELSLDGRVKPVNNCMSIILSAKDKNFKKIYLPAEDFSSINSLNQNNLFPIGHLSELLVSEKRPPVVKECLADIGLVSAKKSALPRLSFSDIKGEEKCKRILKIAVAGGFSLMIFGRDETLKSVLSQAALSLLPAPSEAEQFELQKIYVSQSCPIPMGQRPFIKIGSELSQSSIFAKNQASLQPVGLISLAKYGLVFLQNGQDFSKKVVDKLWCFSRVQLATSFSPEFSSSTNFQIHVSVPTCSCASSDTNNEQCHCSKNQQLAYQDKIRRLFADKIDLYAELGSTDIFRCQRQIADDLQHHTQVTNAYNKRVQSWLVFYDATKLFSFEQLKHELSVSDKASKFLERAILKLSLKTAAVNKIIAVSRTIADLDVREQVNELHIAEAIQYILSPI